MKIKAATVQLEPDNSENNQIIEINSTSIRLKTGQQNLPCLITPNKIQALSFSKITDISEPEISLIKDLQPEVIIIGTGNNQIWPENRLRRLIIEHKLPIEFMSNKAAASTFNLISTENRNVVCLLLLGD